MKFFWLKLKYVKTDGIDPVYKEELSRRERKRKKRWEVMVRKRQGKRGKRETRERKRMKQYPFSKKAEGIGSSGMIENCLR